MGLEKIEKLPLDLVDATKHYEQIILNRCTF